MRKIIDGDVRIDNLCLTELFDLSDVEVTGVFSCRNNKLTSLIGSPHTVGQDFWCENNELTNLIGAPHTVGGSFACTNNNLTSLEGCPITVSGSFYCSGNNLTSLEGIPKTVGGNFYIGKTLEDKFPEEYIRSMCKIKGDVVYV